MVYKVNLYTKPAGLNEIYQQVQMSFALCKAEKKDENIEVTQVTPFCLCRDFLGDALIANQQKKQYGIYGFSFNGAAEKINTDFTYLLVRVPTGDTNNFMKGIKVLHHYESAGKWKKTVIVDTGLLSNDKKVLLFVGSGRWVSSSQLISLYTLLIRCMWKNIKDDESVVDFVKRCSDVDDNDGGYLKRILALNTKYAVDPIEIFVRANRKMFKNTFNFVNNGSIGNYHNSNGVVSLSNQIMQEKDGDFTFLKGVYSAFTEKVKEMKKDV